MMPTMWRSEHIPTTDSTQREVLRRITAECHAATTAAAPTPLALWTLQQTHGQASHGRRWQDSRDGGLAMSMGWPSGHDASPWSALPARISVCVLQTLERLYPEIQARLGLKWPNDIMAGNAKLAGVLVSRHSIESIDWWIAGVGINLAWEAPSTVDRPVTDLKRLGVTMSDPAALVHAVCQDLYDLWTGDGLGLHWEQEFMRRDVLLDCRVSVVHPLTGEVLQHGRHRGVNDQGQLLLECQNQIMTVNIGELSLRGDIL